MARRKEKRLAITLRERGMTYGDIRKRIPTVSKSTLSDWLRGLVLTDNQLEKLYRRRYASRLLSIEKTIKKKLRKRQKRLKRVYKEERIKLLPLSDRELYFCGLFLYWGEGRKSLKSAISLNNTDPRVVKFFHYWLVNILKIPKQKIRVALHLYSDMDKDESILYWSKELGIERNQFIKPYIKKSFRRNIKQKGFGYGTCGLYTNNQYLKEKVMMGINAIAAKFTGIEPNDLI